MSQADNVLSVLRARGHAGVHTFELRGLFIGNPSQRIADLEARGHVIRHSAKERLHGKALGVRYTLVVDAEAPVPVVEQEADGQLRLGEAA